MIERSRGRKETRERASQKKVVKGNQENVGEDILILHLGRVCTPRASQVIHDISSTLIEL